MSIDAPIHTNQSNLSRVLQAGLPVLLVFWKRDCAPCDQLSPTLDRLARGYAGRTLIVKVNADEEPALLARYQVTRLPGLVFVRSGQVVASAAGAASEQELSAWLDFLNGKGSQPAIPSGPSMAIQTGAPAGPSAGPATAPAGGSAAARGNGDGHPVVLTDGDFDQRVMGSSTPVVVDFWAVWCGPCKMVAPVVEDLAREYSGRLMVGKVNVDENPNVAARYGIMSIPTLLVFRGGKLIDRVVGALPAPVLRQRVLQHVQ